MKLAVQTLLVVCVVVVGPLLYAQSSTPPLATLKAAAESGDAQAQSKLGDVYRGRLDSVSALGWYRKAAAQGVAHALHLAGSPPSGDPFSAFASSMP